MSESNLSEATEALRLLRKRVAEMANAAAVRERHGVSDAYTRGAQDAYREVVAEIEARLIAPEPRLRRVKIEV